MDAQATVGSAKVKAPEPLSIQAERQICAGWIRRLLKEKSD
jgi:hypothetical protein